MISTPKLVSLEEIERRVLRGIRTLAAQRDRERDWLRYKVVWPQTLVEWADLLARSENAEDHEPRERFEPTPFDVSDYLTALSWANGLTRTEREVLTLRAWEFSFNAIATRIGGNDAAASKVYRRALQYCFDAANATARAAARQRAADAFRQRTGDRRGRRPG